MKQFTTTALNVENIIGFLNGLSPQEIAKAKGDESIKAISRSQKLIEEIEKQNDSFHQLTKKLDAMSEELGKAAKKQYATYLLMFPNSTDEHKKEKTEIMQSELNTKIEEVRANGMLSLNYGTAGEKEVTIKIDSDERMDLLKLLVEKVGPERFMQRKVLAEIWEALETAKEAV